MKISSIYYTPQQVASFFSIKKDTLLFYDRIGLFSPAIRKENGYRYYEASQINKLDAILTLRDLGFSIPAIKDAIGNMHASSFIALLGKEEESIRNKIASYTSLLRVIDRIRAATEDAINAEKGTLYTAMREAEPIMKFPITTKGQRTSDDEWNSAYKKLIAAADGKSIIAIGSIVRLEDARKNYGDICSEVYTLYGARTGTEIETGRYAYMYFQGSLDGLEGFYRHFLSELSVKKLKPIGDIYEELTISATTAEDESEHVTKLMVRIE